MKKWMRCCSGHMSQGCVSHVTRLCVTCHNVVCHMSQGCVSHVKCCGHMSKVVTCQMLWSHVKCCGHMSKVVTCQMWSHVKGGHMSNVV